MILGILSNHNCFSSVNSRIFIFVYSFLSCEFCARLLALHVCSIKLWCILLCYNTAFYRNKQNLCMCCRDFILMISAQDKQKNVFVLKSLAFYSCSNLV